MLTRLVKKNIEKRLPLVRHYQRPIPQGQLPIYDLALEVLENDKKRIQTELKELRNDKKERSITDQKDYEKRINLLEILEGSNDPEVRSNFENNINVDMSKAYYRYLASKEFNKNGKKSKLIERLLQMKVVPDLIGPINPSIELNFNFPSDERLTKDDGESAIRPCIPGSFVRPGLTFNKPDIDIKIFDTVEDRHYSLLIVDPDVPDVENESYKSYLHYLVPNLKLSAVTSKQEFEQQVKDNVKLDYLPPHPQKGTKYHRYSILLVEQSKPINFDKEINRDGFDTRSYIHDVEGNVEAASMWRAVWDEDTTKVYNEVLKTHEPIYGIPKKISRYLL